MYACCQFVSTDLHIYPHSYTSYGIAPCNTSNMKTDTTTILALVEGFTFNVMGPLLVANLTDEPDSVFNNLPIGEHGMEEVSQGLVTEPHDHNFPSFYKSSNLDVVCDGTLVTLPDRALTLVLPGVNHSWTPKRNTGHVGSVDYRHEKQKLMPAA
jgi:hypothetical protein